MILLTPRGALGNEANCIQTYALEISRNHCDYSPSVLFELAQCLEIHAQRLRESAEEIIRIEGEKVSGRRGCEHPVSGPLSNLEICPECVTIAQRDKS